MDEDGQGDSGASHNPDDETFQQVLAARRIRDNSSFEYGFEGRGDREVGRGGRHQQGSPQLQRGLADLRGFHEQQCLQAEEDLGEGLEDGNCSRRCV